MYLVSLFLSIAMVFLGIAGAELGIAFAHAQQTTIINRLAQDYADQGTKAYLDAVAAQIEAGTFASTGAKGLNSGSPVPVCGKAASSCSYYGEYNVIPTGSTSSTTTGSEFSSDINSSVAETRGAATVTVTITTNAGVPLATKTRSITYRTMPTSPYVSLVNTTDDLAPYFSASGTVGGIQSGTEGDVSGCNAASTCGQTTLVNSYATCNNLALSTAGLSPIQLAQYQLYLRFCHDHSNYNPTAPTSQHFGATSSSVFQNGRWTNVGVRDSGQ
jgi:hypothetical protein